MRGEVHPGQVIHWFQGKTETDKTNSHTLTPNENLEILNKSWFWTVGGEKLERSYKCTWRTCKLHEGRPQAEIQIQDLLIARQQCYHLHHCAPHFSDFVMRHSGRAFASYTEANWSTTVWTAHLVYMIWVIQSQKPIRSSIKDDRISKCT